MNTLNPYSQSFVTFAVKKNQLNKCILICLLFFSGIKGLSQSEKTPDIILTISEELASNESDPEAVAEFIERLSELSENPVILNSASESEISRLFFLSDFQIKSLIDYVHSTGKILSVFEIAGIPGFDRQSVEMMIPFITLEGSPAQKKDNVRWNNNLLANLSFKPSENDTISIGSPFKLLTKYRFRAGGFSGGLTLEKDQGEKLISGIPPLPEFLSAHISYSGSGILRKVIIGDYSARFGLGTNTNSGIRTGLSLSAPGFISSRNEIKPYTSADENNFFRGVSASFSYKYIDLALFYSKNNIDASYNDTDSSADRSVKTFLSGGIHNTNSLLAKKDAVTDEAFGINLSANYKNIRLGFTWSEDRFSLPVKTDKSSTESLFDFEGTINNVYSLSYNMLIKRTMLFGELSLNDSKKSAFVQGISLRPADRLSLNFIFRNYDAGFFSFHGKGPGTGSKSENEHGITGTFTFEAAKHLFLSGGCDIYRFEWLRYRNSGPSAGIKKEIKLKFSPKETIAFDLSYNYRMLMSDGEGTKGIPVQSETVTRHGRLSFRFLLNENITLTSRLDYNIVKPSGSRGVMLLQDLSYRFRNIPLSVWLRYCLFTTDDWESRIYCYENDLLYSFSIPALSGKGSRSYIMLKYEISKHTDLRIKFGLTSFESSHEIFEEKSEIKTQFRIWF